MKSLKNIISICLSIAIMGLIFLSPIVFAQSDVTKNAQVNTSNAGLVAKVAPGELLPISVKLLNFGGGKKVDVTLSYEITDLNGKIILKNSETVAVETTASFIKEIQIPFDTVPGRYIAKSSITYLDQVAPATTEFPFIVESKIFGLFQEEFYLYGSILLIVGVIMGIMGRLWVRRRRATRLMPMDYGDIAHDKRIFYEILSDIIMEMRERVGDDALLIASHIDGLKIDKETGRILAFMERPSKVIATLVSKYEELLGKKVSFSFRQNKTGL